MKISYEWLKEYVDLDLTPGESAESLTMLGFESSVGSKLFGQNIIDVEVTANRPDCLSVLGLARELSALRNKKLLSPQIEVKEGKEKTEELICVEIKSKNCRRYCARVIREVNVAESPEWLKKRLAASGIRSVNNVVDITNYVLMELGHPLHAFDYDLIGGRRIIVRSAYEGEILITLDKLERKLKPWMLVIADEKRAVALAGIMGGFETQVTEKTKTVLLESAYFEPSLIRRTSKDLGIETESSYRFQRKADIDATVSAINRASQLIQEVAKGNVAQGIFDCYPEKQGKENVCLRMSRLKSILGAEPGSEYVSEKLEALGFGMLKEGERFTVSVPSFRRDVAREIDLIEEIARHYGYDKVPMTLPSGKLSSPKEDKIADAKERTRSALSASGLNEVITHGLISERFSNIFDSGNRPVKVKNPLSEEQSVLRNSLIPGLLRTLALNLSRGVDDVLIFELGNIFCFGKNSRPVERLSLSGAMTGSRSWGLKKQRASFYDVKGAVENLLQAFGIESWSLDEKASRIFDGSESALIRIGDSEAGLLGKVAEDVKEIFSVERDAYIFEIDFEKLITHIKSKKEFELLPKFPANLRDIAIVVPEKVRSADIVDSIVREGKGIVEKAALFDIYRGKQVKDGYKSMAYSIVYRSGDRTLKDREVDMLHDEISGKLVSRFNGEIR